MCAHRRPLSVRKHSSAVLMELHGLLRLNSSNQLAGNAEARRSRAACPRLKNPYVDPLLGSLYIGFRSICSPSS